jgi:hypothetical protein
VVKGDLEDVSTLTHAVSGILLTDTAIGKTFELFAAPGPATQD